MEKLSLHRALAELKVLTDRIDKANGSLLVCGFAQKDKLVNNKYEKSKFEEDAKSSYQSITDLIKRRQAIKSAVVKANTTILVKIGDKEMTLSDAITQKMYIAQEKALLNALKVNYNGAMASVEKHNAVIDDQAKKLTELQVGKEGTTKETVEGIMKSFLENNRVTLVDPLGIADLIKGRELAISTFEANVDAVLSEANAINSIEF